MRSSLLFLVLLAACGTERPADDDNDPTTETDVSDDTDAPPEGCGDGVIASGEECDDGEGNSDELADACRTDCLLPACGDGITDTEEGCDDGNTLGGDGCSTRCRTETEPGEVEPNNVPAQATPLTPGTAVLGGLSELDQDCWSFAVSDNSFIDARATGLDGSCPPAMTLHLYDDARHLEVSVFPEDATSCAHLDPATNNDLLYLDEGTYTVCVEGLFRSAVPAYRLTVEVGDDSCIGTGTPDPSDDLDLDGLADPCDSDDDDDGVADISDNCPRIPNGPSIAPFSTSVDGYIRQWLMLGPVTGTTTSTGCLPSEDQLGEDDGAVVPALGDEALGLSWTAVFEPQGRIDFLDLISSSAPREVYVTSWVNSPETRDVTLAIGADDGARAWVNGAMIGETSTCQGVVTDQFEWDTQLQAGWNRVMIKVRDHGGGWGVIARFYDEAGVWLEDLDVSIQADAAWEDDQTDSDGDGIGDVCDLTP